MPSIFALIDCNNFFVSCERIFRPELNNTPVVVLSSNDGCVVSRSNEAKALGIPMGAPAFKYKSIFKEQGIVQFSANFELYGDISQRIVKALTRIIPKIEVYSVDESFLELSNLGIKDYTAWGQAVRYSILKSVGVPVAVGIAPSKTMAKLAAERAKKTPSMNDVLDLQSLSPEARKPYLLQTPISDVWGVGWRLTPKLKAEGVFNALDLSYMRPKHAQSLMGIHGRQMVAELNGQSCLPLTIEGKDRQTIMHGRMFGEDTNNFAVIEAVIASLSGRAARQLRVDKLLAKRAVVHLSTNKHKPGYRKFSFPVSFLTPSNDSGVLSGELIKAVRASLSPSVAIHRANVLFYDLTRENGLQIDITGDLDLGQLSRSKSRFEAFDSINDRYGKSTIYLAAEDLSKVWQPKKALKSPSYTTDWNDLPILKIRQNT
jgi:DNA polymerase V